MMPTSYATPAPEAPRRTKVSAAEVVDHLWEKVLVEAGPLEIHSDCEQQLRAIIQQGAKRMFAENRTTRKDFEGFPANTTVKFYVECHDAAGDSAASEVVEVTLG